eukprot:gnl/Chilomastix_caulleri/1235.p1 GENE.gnl/Chilomastix_caulleri/1235~~gnl/Chilomastix_caulleri/1235.p1  ORF type:complete len:168 (+),score=11.34 gnl/Chilomastix_caulleri/1235:75-578(+)
MSATSPLLNPKSAKFTHLRASLITGMLKSVKHNMSRQKPLQYFEIGDVVCVTKKPTSTPTDTVPNTFIGQRLHCAGIRCSTTDGFEYVKGLLDLIGRKVATRGCRLVLRECDLPVFAKHRAALIVCVGKESEQVCGIAGVMAPEVLQRQGITFPTSYMEMDIGIFVE